MSGMQYHWMLCGAEQMPKSRQSSWDNPPVLQDGWTKQQLNIFTEDSARWGK